MNRRMTCITPDDDRTEQSLAPGMTDDELDHFERVVDNLDMDEAAALRKRN